ncbi:MAG: hypothetical protein H0Z37_02045 [Firmicutes bacterium]|nr:hypothetical protein [Bacillota bacterium]
MKKGYLAPALVAVLLLGATALAAAADASFEAPVLITSAGQSPGALMLRVLADRAGVANTFDAVATPDALDGMKSLMVVIGASMKGLGAAGIDLEDEFARVQSLLERAKEQDIAVIALHVEGWARRGTSSDDLAAAVFPYASYAIVRADGNADGYFNELAGQHGVELEIVHATADVAGVLQRLYGN